MPEVSGWKGHWPVRSKPPRYTCRDIYWKVCNIGIPELLSTNNKAQSGQTLFKKYKPSELPLPDNVFLFHKAGRVGKLFVAYQGEEDRECVERFMLYFVGECAFWDIEIDEMVDESVNDGTPPLVLFFQNSRYMISHDNVKLLETLHQLRIMEIKTESALTALGDFKRTKQLMREFNVKIGGQNFAEDPNNFWRTFSDDNLMIVSYCVAHPYSKSLNAPFPMQWTEEIPSIVGFSANFTANPSTFIADFGFQPAFEEEVWDSIINEKLNWFLHKRFVNTGRLPDHIILIRDGLHVVPNIGVSHLSSANRAVRKELMSFRNACTRFCEGYKPKFGAVLSSKDCRGRTIYRDALFDNKEMKHKFYLHFNKLTSKHQVSGSNMSTPSPVHSASHMASVGGRIFAAFRDRGFVLPSYEGSYIRNPMDPRFKPHMKTVIWNEVSDILSYKDKKLEELH